MQEWLAEPNEIVSKFTYVTMRRRRSEVHRSDTGRSRVHREAKCARIEILWTGAGVVELAALEKR